MTLSYTHTDTEVVKETRDTYEVYYNGAYYGDIIEIKDHKSGKVFWQADNTGFEKHETREQAARALWRD